MLAVADAEEEPKGSNPPLSFRLKWGPKDGKKFLGDRGLPLSKGLDDRPFPHLKDWIRHWCLSNKM